MWSGIYHSLRVSIAAISLLAAVGQVHASTYYVDYSSGSDSANGTSTSTPWQHCPGDALATGTPASASLSAGDTVHFKGGVQYVFVTGGIALNWNGTAGNPITYDGNSAGTWGTGRAVLTDNHGTNVGNAFFKAPYDPISNLVFNNLEIGPMGGAATLPPDPGGTNYAPDGITQNWGGGISCGGSMNNVTIENCYFHELGYWQNAKPIGNNSIGGIGVAMVSCRSLVITNCEFTKVARPIAINISGVATNIVVANCYFHDYIVWSMDMAVTSTNAYMDDIQIHGNTFTNFDKWYSAAYWTGYAGAPHQDGILERGESVTEVPGGGTPGTFFCGTNINYYNNLFMDNSGGSGGSCAINVSGGCSANIYNNLFYGMREPNGVVSYQSPPPNQNFLFQVFNNTFYLWNAVAIYLDGSVNVINQYGEVSAGNFYWPDLNWVVFTTNIYLPKTNVVQVVIKNNLMVDGGPDFWGALVSWDTTNVPLSQFTIDNNLYSTVNFTMIAAGADLPYVPTTLSGMRSIGWETHGLAANPLFVNTSYTNGDLNYLNDFHLRTNSPAIGAGANLTSLGLPGLNFDMDGNPRPATGNWTIGAFETASMKPFVSVVASPTSIINGQSTTLTWASVNATNVTLNGDSVPLNGSNNVLVSKTTAYTVMAAGPKGTYSASVTVTNIPSPPSLLRLQ